MNQRESPRSWPLLLFVSSAIVFGIIAPFFGGMLVGAFTDRSRSKTLEIVRYVDSSSSAQPALSTAPAFTRQAESATPAFSSRRGAAEP